MSSKPKGNALDVQVGGGHYKDCGIQPVEYIHANKMPYLDGCVVKYITRHGKKGGKKKAIEDLKKLKHYVDLIMLHDYGVQPDGTPVRKRKPKPKQKTIP